MGRTRHVLGEKLSRRMARLRRTSRRIVDEALTNLTPDSAARQNLEDRHVVIAPGSLQSLRRAAKQAGFILSL